MRTRYVVGRGIERGRASEVLHTAFNKGDTDLPLNKIAAQLHHLRNRFPKYLAELRGMLPTQFLGRPPFPCKASMLQDSARDKNRRDAIAIACSPLGDDGHPIAFTILRHIRFPNTKEEEEIPNASCIEVK